VAEYLMIAAVAVAEMNDDFALLEMEGGKLLFERAWFEDNAVEIEPGTGPALKAVAATALLGAMHNARPLPGLPQDAANDETTAAQRGEFNDAMITGVARIAFNVVREWKKYEGILHHPPFDETGDNTRNMACQRVRNIAQNKRYPLDIANKAAVFEDQLYRMITASVLAD